MSLEVGNLEMLVTVLTEISNPDNLRQAEQLLMNYRQDPRCITDLITVLTTAGVDISARQQAGIQLQHCKNHYKKLSDTDRKTIAQMTLQIIASEENMVVCRKLCEVAAILFKLALKNNEEWPELFNLITQLAGHENELYRKLNFELVERLFEVNPKKLSPLLDNILSLINAGISESSDQVRCAALNCSCEIFTRYSDLNRAEEIGKFLPVVGPIIQCTLQAIQNKDEDVALKGLEFVQICCHSDFEVVDAHLDQLLPFLISVLKSDADIGTKKAASQCIQDTFENEKRAKRLRDSTALISGCLTELVRLVSDANKSSSDFLLSIQHQTDDDEDDGDYDPEEDLDKHVFDCVSKMAENIPGKYFHPLAFQLYQECMTSGDANLIRGGCLLFAGIIEGCREYIIPQLSTLMQPLIPLLDPSMQINIREIAFFGLDRLLQHCNPDIYSLYESYFPYFAPNLLSSNPMIHITIANCIAFLGESLADFETTGIKVDIDVYVDEIFTGFSSILSKEDTANDVKTGIFDAIGGVATLLQEKFTPYAGPILQAIAPSISTDDREKNEVCAHALEAFGCIAIAVGRDVFREYFNSSLKVAVSLLSANDELVSEFVFMFISNTAQCMGEEYEPYLAQLVPHLINVVSQQEEHIPQNEVDDGEDGEEEDVEDVEDVDDDEERGVVQGFTQTKIAAIGALGDLMKWTNAHFAPYIQHAVTLLLDGSRPECPLNSHIDEIKQEVINASQNIAHALKNVFQMGEPVKGTKQELSSDVETCLGYCLSVYVNTCATESNNLIVFSAIMAAHELFEVIGMAALDVKDSSGNSYFSTFEQIIAAILSKQTPCQKDQKYDLEPEEDPICAAMELVGLLAKCIGPSYLPYFDKLAPLVSPYLDPECEYFDHAIGVFAEVVFEAGSEECIRYLEPLLSHLQAGLAHSGSRERHNSAFAVSAFVESCPSGLSPEIYQHFLTWLLPVAAQQTESFYTSRFDIENALSAIVRIIKTGFTVPYDQVIPTIVEALPVRSDVTEAPVIYGCIFTLLNANEPTTTSLLPKILSALAFCLSKSKDEPETKALVSEQLKAYYLSNSELVTAAAGQITDATVIATLTAVFQ